MRLRALSLPPNFAPVSQHHHSHEHEESPHHKAERFARIRRVKSLLKYVPRRAVMHKYPIVGRFSEMARKRAYLWSMKPEHMRPAFYAGSILSLLPVMGAQIPIALLLAILLRANFMVMGGLQFITNPFTVAPIYLATHQLGAYVIRTIGIGTAPAAADPHEAVLPVAEPVDPRKPEAQAIHLSPDTQAGISRAQRVGTAINALILGGVISGLALGLVLDIFYRNYWQHHTLAPKGRRKRRSASGATSPPGHSPREPNDAP